MSRYIVTANYTAQAINGMVENPGDREAAIRPFVEASGGTLIDYYVTTGAKDFLLIVDADDMTDLIAGLMVSGAAGMISNVETIQAFNTDAFTTMQQKARTLASKARPPGT